ncbi:hypothetical protein ACOMHN_024214 [Nucella lapillus]
MLWVIVPPVLLIFGTFGNVMIVVVMRGLRASQSTACLSVYFTALAVSDQCTLVTSTLWLWIEGVFSWPPSFFVFDLLCTIPKFVWYVCPLMSAWFLVAMTYQRVTSVVAPHRVGVLCTVGRGKIVIAAIVIIACAINLHVLFTFAYRHEYKACLPGVNYADFIYLFTWLDLLWASAIPFLLLVGGNAVLIVHVIKSLALFQGMRGTRNPVPASRSNQIYPMTMTLILTSAAFLILTLPICIVHAYRRAIPTEITDEDVLAELNLAKAVGLFLWASACASNFYLYLLSGSKFRQETKRYFGWHETNKGSKKATDLKTF